VAVWIRVFDAAVHPKLQWCRTDLDTRPDFNPFICLIRRPIAEFGEADDVNADLIDLHLFDQFDLRGKIHRKGCDDVLGGRGSVIERDDRH
jgi:hypothetical protein